MFVHRVNLQAVELFHKLCESFEKTKTIPPNMHEIRTIFRLRYITQLTRM